ncbi:hypothetical protein [Streptomyces graminilatus]|uniref:hypothetical protein n=1 Tax=Streptomyces graminilatus TaxID=1464070 RepID=UPI0006E3113F|nr:hypothetical protein [Streptomyces graminilatus]
MTTITRAATAAAICAAVLMTASACSSDSPKPAGKEAAAAPSPSTSAQSGGEKGGTQEVAGASVAEVPKIDGKKIVASFANGKSSQTIPIKGGLAQGTIGIVLNCMGEGTVKVDIPAVPGLTFTEECTIGKVATISNDAKVKSAAPNASLQVTPSSGVSWSIAVGV